MHNDIYTHIYIHPPLVTRFRSFAGTQQQHIYPRQRLYHVLYMAKTCLSYAFCGAHDKGLLCVAYGKEGRRRGVHYYCCHYEPSRFQFYREYNANLDLCKNNFGASYVRESLSLFRVGVTLVLDLAHMPAHDRQNVRIKYAQK